MEQYEPPSPQTSRDFALAKLNDAKQSITNFFDKFQKKALKRNDLTGIFAEEKDAWKLPHTVSSKDFIDYMISELPLKEIILPSSYEKVEKRYIWRTPSEYEVALSLRVNSYLCHGTAAFLYGLTNPKSQIIYINYEQSPKPKSAGILTQEGISKAFGSKQRQSNLSYTYNDLNIVLVNGKNTNNLEVVLIKHQKAVLQITSIERTLIDMIVRPSYAGGVDNVLSAFKKAKGQISPAILLATLKKLDYVYPYNQAIGFYMERAGYSKKDWSKFLKIGTDYDFYLAHDLPKSRKYDKKWRLFYPDSI